jgi:hypothetical protein
MGKLHDLAEIEEKNIQKKKSVKFSIPTNKFQKDHRTVFIIIKRFETD